MNHEEALNGANPNYSKAGTAYKRNCYLCTPTYELRRRGFDVEAEASLPKKLDNVPNRLEKTGIAFTEKAFIDPETGKSRTPEPVRLDSDGQPNNIHIADDPDGARYLVGVTFKSGGGHAFFAEKIGDSIVYSDPQNPKRSHSYLAKQAKNAAKGEFRFTRVDDQEINTAVIHKVCRPTGGK
ncbi:MAG: hypothetical protein LIO74_01805 [Ruminococcus sp.]|nr:hypothetical protein [Ruminococcus sp.]